MIITEKEKSSVIFSSLLYRHYPKLVHELSDIMWKYQKGYGAVSHTKDYWVRDFMPIQTEENVFVKFIFNPDYLQEQKKYITDVDIVIKHCPFAEDYEIVNVPIILDGGNMVFCKGCRYGIDCPYVVMTEKVLVENPKYSKYQVEQIIRYAFHEYNMPIVWLPWDSKDIFGHTDGIVRYIGTDENGKPRVLVNLKLYDEEIANCMYEALVKHFEVIELKLSHYDELSWAYINCVQTQDYIIISGIGDPVTDAEVVAQYKDLFPEYEDNIYQVQMHDFIKEHGGALNCCTWTIYKNYSKMLAKGAHTPAIDLEEDLPFIEMSRQHEMDKLLKEFECITE